MTCLSKVFLIAFLVSPGCRTVETDPNVYTDCTLEVVITLQYQRVSQSVGPWEYGTRGYIKNLGPAITSFVKIIAQTTNARRDFLLGTLHPGQQADFDTGYMAGDQAPTLEFSSSCSDP